MADLRRSQLEKLPGELRNMIFSYTLLAPDRTIDISKIEHKMPASLQFPERKRRFRNFACEPRDLKDKICFPFLRLNKSISAEAIEYLYGQNTFHLHAAAFEASHQRPECRTGTLEFLSKLSPEARHAIRNVQLLVSPWFLNSVRWDPLCEYFATEMHIIHLRLTTAIVYDGANPGSLSLDQVANSRLRALCNPIHPWIASVAKIRGLDSFDIHSDQCRFLESGSQDSCWTVAPAREVEVDDPELALIFTYWIRHPCFPLAFRLLVREKLGLGRGFSLLPKPENPFSSRMQFIRHWFV